MSNEFINGRYKIEKELGRGGFGVAYLARDTHMHSQGVVVKILHEADGGRIERELKALTRISHPHVVRVYGHGWTSDGEPFFVMQHVEGKSLREAIGDGAMELKRAARIISQLGSALSAVHDAGVIHRDVKPDNVMLQTSRNDEFAILIDFGVATVKDFQTMRSTQETWPGTPIYMAPEQLRGRPVPASDVWALGVVAHEMVTGRRPFSSEAEVLTLNHTSWADIANRLKARRPDLPQAAQGVILKALSYDLSARYAHAHEMGDAFLRAILDPEPAPPPPPISESPKELLTRCQELFESFDEFRSPDSLHAFFSVAELRGYEKCVGRGIRLEFDQLLDCLSNRGREYRGQALIELLGVLALRYKEDYRGQECERLKGALRRVLERAPAAGR